MNKVNIIGLDSIKTELMKRIMDLGVVEISSQDTKLTDPEWTSYVKKDGNENVVNNLDVKISQINEVLNTLELYDTSKRPLFTTRKTISSDEFRKKLEEMIIKKKGVIYIQKGNRLSKHAIEYSLNNWWKENYSDRSDLEFRETRPGEIFPGEINIDNTKKSGEPFQIREDGTICIDSIRDRRMGTRSSIQNLARLGLSSTPFVGPLSEIEFGVKGTVA